MTRATMPARQQAPAEVAVFARRAACLALAVGLAGCAAPQKLQGSDVLSGRLAVRVDALGTEQPARGFTADFELRGDAERGELRLAGALGSTVGAARWAPGEAVLVTAEGERRFDSLDALAREALGEPVPLQALPSWLRGQAWSGQPATARDTGFDQLGWTISLARRAEGWIEATRERPPRVQVRARLDSPF